jgi:hypothetical protein
VRWVAQSLKQKKFRGGLARRFREKILYEEKAGGSPPLNVPVLDPNVPQAGLGRSELAFRQFIGNFIRVEDLAQDLSHGAHVDGNRPVD